MNLKSLEYPCLGILLGFSSLVYEWEGFIPPWVRLIEKTNTEAFKPILLRHQRQKQII